MTIFHFTGIFALAGIVRAGIAHGEVAVTPVHVIDFPWFTSDFAHAGQSDWVGSIRSKLALRLEVVFDQKDQQLARWRDYAKRLKLRADWYEELTGPNVANNGRAWYVYRGVVPFDRVTCGYYHPCHERVTPMALRRAAEVIQMSPLRTRTTTLRQEGTQPAGI